MSAAWSEAASAQLRAVRDYLARTSPGYAQALAEHVLDPADAPLSGAEVPEYGDPGLREFYEHPYRVLYRLVEPGIEVVSVVHSSRRLPRSPPG